MVRNPAAIAGSAVLLGGAALLLATPTLNNDDLLFAWHTPALFAHEGLAHALLAGFLNLDIGAGQTRTYGLAKVIQLLTDAAFGRWPVPAFALIIAIQYAGGWFLGRLVELASGSRRAAWLAGLAWAAAPAGLSMLETEHHFLYLVAPFDALFAWLWLALSRPVSPRWCVAGAALLLCVWSLGESAIVSAAGAIVLCGWFLQPEPARLRMMAIQGAIAGLTLAAYLAFERFVVHQAGVAQRFPFAPPSTWHETAGRATRFAQALWQSGRAVSGLGFTDQELGPTPVAGFGAIDLPVTWILIAALACVLSLGVRDAPPAASRRPWILLVLMAIAASSVAPAGALLFGSRAALAVRYFMPFFALLPPVAIAAIAVARPRDLILPAAICAATLALFAVSLAQAERLVNSRTRERLAAFHTRALAGQDVLILSATGYPVDPRGITDGWRPGIVSIFSSGLADPMRSAWTVIPSLDLYAHTKTKMACRDGGDGLLETWEGGQRTLWPRSRAYALRLNNPFDSSDSAVELPLERACPNGS